MTPQVRFRMALGQLDMNREMAADFLGVSPQTIYRYQWRDPAPLPIMMLLSVMASRQITPEEARDLAGVPLPPLEDELP